MIKMKNTKYLLFTLIFISTYLYSQSKGGYWSFSGNGNDTAEWDNNNNIGTLIAPALYSSDNGINGTYLSCDVIGANDYFLIGDDPDLDFESENVGISVWINPSVLNDVHYIVNKGDQYVQPKTTNYSLRISKSNNLEFLIRDQANQAQKVASSFTISINAWQFIAVYYDFDNKIVYFWNDPDTDPIDSITFEVRPISNNAPLVIGSWYKSQPPNSSVKDFEGWIDEVRISGRKEDIFPNQQLDIASEKESLAELRFSLYPNPISKSNSSNSIKINFYVNENSEFLLKVYSILGREIYSKSFKSIDTNSQFNLPVKNLNSGIYLVSLINSNRTQTKKLLILK